jgi:hypothetical protein
VWGEVRFKGTTQQSHFNYTTTENTYIRGGKTTSDVIICDVNRNCGVGLSNPSYKLHVSGGLCKLDNAVIGTFANDPAYAQFMNANLANNGTNYAIIQNTNGTTLINASSGRNILFRIGNSQKITISSGGFMGIGISSPSAPLHVQGSIICNSGTIFTENLNIGNWDIYHWAGGTTSTYGNTLTNGDLVFNSTSSTFDAGLMWLKQSQTNADNLDFTGQHRSVSENSNLYSSNYIGYIVASTGNYKDLNSKVQNNKQNIKINSSLPHVELTDKTECKKIYGVISDKEGDNENRNYNIGGALHASFKQDENDQRLIINALGEGAIWVSNYNGILENGDYITSSPIPGLGMKQNDDILHNYTVAKITMDCDFNPINDDEYEMKYIQLDGTIITIDEYDSNVDYKMSFVGCTYHCG